MKKIEAKVKRALAVLFSIAVAFCLFSPSSALSVKATAAEADGVVLDKSYDAANGLLKLEAYVTGEKVSYTVQEAVPLDIVLVLDGTSSMKSGTHELATSMTQLNELCKDCASLYKYHLGFLKNRSMRFNETSQKWEYQDGSSWVEITKVSSSNYVYVDSNLDALKAASIEFVRTVASNSPNSRIGIVKFGEDPHTILNRLTVCNTEGCATMISNISSIKADYDATDIAGGIDVGETLFDYTSTRQKIMIVFTDGEPNECSYDDCVDSAYAVKQKGVTVYTVGCFDDLEDEEEEDINELMTFMSSKYPDAHSSDYYYDEYDYDKVNEGTYYYSVSSTNSITSIFQTIAKEVTEGGAKETRLTSGTILRDIIAEKFVYDNSDDKKTRVYTSSYIGENQWDTPIEITDGSVTVSYDATTKKIDVSNFDYSANWCGKETSDEGTVTYRGKKLIVTIPIKLADGAEGETGANTNDPGSGIILPGEDKPISEFPVPTTDIPTDISITKKFEGYVPEDATFSFTASVSDYITGYLPADANKYTKATTEAKSYDTIQLGKDEATDVIKNVLVATASRASTVTITEKSVAVGYSVTISDGTTSETFVGNGGDVSKTFTVTAGMNITVTNTKANPSTQSVTIKNTVSGNMGDKNKEFGYSGSYMLKSVSSTLSENLKHGETQTFAQVDYGSTFTISQTNADGYTTKVLVNGVELNPVDGVYSFTVTQDTTVEFQNVKEDNISTGVVLEYLPYVLILAVIVAVIVVMIIRKRKNVDYDG